jgi:hypothetical protein
MITELALPIFILVIIASAKFKEYWDGFTLLESLGAALSLIVLLVTCGLTFYEFFSKSARERKKRKEMILELPVSLITRSEPGVYLGEEADLQIPIYLPDSIRSRHVHILGATGSGKTESVILNFLKQDVARDLGTIILDAKGDASFLSELRACVPKERLQVFDLSCEKSTPYDPLASGGPMEAAQRLFSSLQWSEEYYKSKAFNALQNLFETHSKVKKRNPTLSELAEYLETPESYIAVLNLGTDEAKLAKKSFDELSGLRDQVRGLCIGYLKVILSPCFGQGINLEEASNGKVIYFRLQSLLSTQLVSVVGKLVINHLNYLAGTAHRNSEIKKKFIPTYLDEFASFACPEFADLISKARSAGLALHFSHQSVGDLTEISPGFVGRITDNSATKIVLRISDPDSAEMMARTFGTSLYQKVTQRLTNAQDLEEAEVTPEGSQREAHRFRASPDLLKTLPTGVGSVLIAHGQETPHGASSVFKVRFPRLNSINFTQNPSLHHSEPVTSQQT